MRVNLRTFSIVAALAVATILSGCAGSRDAATSRSAGDAQAPSKFSPYADATLSNFDFSSATRSAGLRSITLAFVTRNSNGDFVWGSTPYNRAGFNDAARSFVAAGNEVVISFGGAAGSELKGSQFSPDDLANRYAQVADEYRAARLDFDVEGPSALEDSAAITLRNQALIKLRTIRPNLTLSYTLASAPDWGVTGPNAGATPQNVLENAKQNGFVPDVVNLMTMDYGVWYMSQPSFNSSASQDVKLSADMASQYLSSLWGVDRQTAYGKLIVTPMIGVNDKSPNGQLTAPTFQLDDANSVTDYVRQQGLAGVSMWSLGRDNPGQPGEVTYYSSGILQDQYEFSRRFSKVNDPLPTPPAPTTASPTQPGPTPPSPSPTFTGGPVLEVTYARSAWAGGGYINATVKNVSGVPITNWTVNTPWNVTLSDEPWGVKNNAASRSSGNVNVSNADEWSGKIDPGATVGFGFNVTIAGTPFPADPTTCTAVTSISASPATCTVTVTGANWIAP